MRRGFTLVELLVVISIIGVLVGSTSVVYNNARDKGRDSKRKQDLASIQSALALYFEENGGYPCDTTAPAACTKTSFVSSETQPWIPNLVPSFIKELPQDPKQAGILTQLASMFLIRKQPQSIPVQDQGQVAGSTIVAFDSASSAAGSSSTSYSWSHTVGTGTNRILVVGVSIRSAPPAPTVTSITYGGVGLTSIGNRVCSIAVCNGQLRVEMWRLLNPNVGTATLSVNLSGAPWGSVAGASSWSGVDQTNPTGTFASDSNWGYPSVTVSSAADEVVIDAFVRPDSSGGTNTPGTGQTQMWNTWSFGDTRGAGSWKNGATTTTMSWTTNIEAWVIGAVSLKPLPSAPTVTTLAATGFTTNSATLNGSVNPNGDSTSGWFRWGPSNVACSSLPNITTSQSLGSGKTAVNYSQNITGLSPATPYYFCAVASNSIGTSYGSVLSFTTQTPTPPTVTLTANGSGDPILVPSGSQVTLVWTTTNSPTSCTASGFWSGAKSTSGGSEIRTVTTSGIYTLTCSNAGGSANDSVTVNVIAQSPVPSPSPPPPSPTPTPSPTPSPVSEPSGDCAGASNVYCYMVSADRRSYILWTRLDNTNDAEIYNKIGAKCTRVPPAGTTFNYCVRPEF